MAFILWSFFEISNSDEMRPLLIALAFSVLSCNSQATSSGGDTAAKGTDQPAEAPDIHIEVAGLQPGTAYLIGIYADQKYRLDSAQVDASGKIHFKQDEPYRQGAVFALLPNNTNFQLLVTTDQAFSMKTQSGNLVGAMVVEGSIDNELLYRNLKFQEDFQPRLNAVSQQLQQAPEGSAARQQLEEQQKALIAERQAHLDEIFNEYPNTFFTTYKRSGQNPEYVVIRRPDGSVDTEATLYQYRSQMWDNVDFSDERLLYTPVIANKLNRYINELTVQNPDSIISSTAFLVDKVLDYPEYYKFIVNWVTLKYEPTKTSLMDAEAVFVYMIQNYFTRERAFWSDSMEIYGLQQRAGEMAASLVGKPAPDVQAQGPDGRMYSISGIQAPYIVVYMYNPTCEHCMEQTPKLVNFYRQWKNRGVEVFGIAIDTDDAEWKNYIAKTGMNWINVFDPTNKSIYAKYYVDITPEIYLIGPDRTIIAKNLKVSQLEEVINRDMARRQ